MAGIGFALERLYRSNSFAGRMASFAHASIVAAGPCLLSVLGIWLISATISELEGKTTIAAFRALIIYSFALSFVATAPIALVSARIMSDELHDFRISNIPGIVLAALTFSAVLTIAAATALFAVGFVKLIVDVIGMHWHVAADTLLILFAAFQVIAIGLLADLVTRATRAREEKPPASA